MVFLLAFLVFGIVLLGMSVGVILSNRRIRGSCGGLANLHHKHGKVTACEGCPSGGGKCHEDSPDAIRCHESAED